MLDETFSTGVAAHGAILKAFTAFVVSRAIYAAARLDIADHLIDGPRSVDHLASKSETDSFTLYRLLRTLASEGIFEEVSDRVFGLTPSAACLQRGAPNSIRSYVLLLGDESHQRSWDELTYSVRTGAAAFSHVWGRAAVPVLSWSTRRIDFQRGHER